MKKISRFVKERNKIFKFFKRISYDQKNKIFVEYGTKKIYNWTQLASRIKKSVKQTRRVYKQFLTSSPEDFILHKNINNQINVKYGLEERKKIIEMYVDYSKTDTNTFIPFTHADFIFDVKSNENINLPSDSTIYKILSENNVVSSFANRKTKRLHKRKNKNYTLSDLEKLITKAIQYDHKEFKIKDNLKFGERIELDGCSHNWLPHGLTEFDRERKITFHGACDSSGYLLSVTADYEETNNGYTMLLNDVFKAYGAPKEIRGDKRTSFQYKGLNNTILGKAITSLGIALNCESYGQHKPNIEVTWWIMQRWLPKQLEKKNINTIDKLMDFVNSGELTKLYNKRFKKLKHLEKEWAFRKLFEHEVRCAFIVKETRKVQKGNFLKIDNDYWYPINDLGERVTMDEKRKHPIFDVHHDLIENKMFIKRCNQKLFLKKADYKIDFFDRDKLLSAIESENEFIIYNLEHTNNVLQNNINKLSSLIYNSNNSYLIKKLEEIGLQK